jgi:hypothetical protein
LNPRKIFAITIALSKSQLRASRGGRAALSFLRKPSILLILDIAAFAICAVLGYAGVTLLKEFSGPGASTGSLQAYSDVENAVREALIFIPVFVPGMVLIAGLLFELNVSSKFSASDTVNWLPITQAEYVIASALSVAYNYSISVAIALGITLAPSVYFGYGWAWAGVALVSILTLFTGGALVEILRAATNRVSSVVMKRARRGALFFRLALMVVIILIFETVFNPTILISVVNTLSGSLSVFVFIPLFWGALAIEGIVNGEPLRVLVFSVGTVGFTGALVWIATRVRSRYWSPAAFSVSITSSEYAPRSSSLLRMGLSQGEAAIVRKDIKGITRRRELLSFMAIPIVFVALFLVESITSTSGGIAAEGGFFADFPTLFAASFFALLISSISFGQESKSVMILYSLPIAPGEILRAKAFLALGFSLAATFATLAIFSVIGGSSPLVLVENITIAASITVEEVCVGLAFGSRFPDFQERPRPRFIDPVWLLVMTAVGLAVALVTALPIIFRDILSALPGTLSAPWYLFPAAWVFAGVVSVLAYRFAKGSSEKLMAEYRI